MARDHIDRVLELCGNATQRSPEHGYPPSPYGPTIDVILDIDTSGFEAASAPFFEYRENPPYIDPSEYAADPELVPLTPEHLAAIFGVPYAATTMPTPNQGACHD